MSTEGLSNAHAQIGAVKRTPELDLEVWKHFAEMGGTDKNTMIATVSWLLAFAATGIGYIVTDSQIIGPTSPQVQQPGRMMTVSLLGIFVSVVAWYLAIVYGGYSNRNWAKADEIARRREWSDLLPEGSPDKMTPERRCKPDGLAAFAWRRARPCYPQTELAPVFKIFSFLAFLSALTHGALFLWGTLYMVSRILRA